MLLPVAGNPGIDTKREATQAPESVHDNALHDIT
jgi:hypothetical protein